MFSENHNETIFDATFLHFNFLDVREGRFKLYPTPCILNQKQHGHQIWHEYR